MFSYEVIDPENNILDFEFVLMPESTDKKSGSDLKKHQNQFHLKL